MTRCVNRTFLPSMFVRSVGRRCRDGFGFGPSHARQIPRCGAPRRPGLKITILLDGHWLHRPVARTFRNVEWTGDGGQVCPVLVASVNSNAPSSRKQRPDGIDNTADTYRATCPGRVGCRTSRAMREAGPTRDSFATVLECLSSQRLTERGNQTARRSWNLLLTTMGGGSSLAVRFVPSEAGCFDKDPYPMGLVARYHPKLDDASLGTSRGSCFHAQFWRSAPLRSASGRFEPRWNTAGSARK